jgi:hypothetical protein
MTLLMHLLFHRRHDWHRGGWKFVLVGAARGLEPIIASVCKNLMDGERSQ